MSKPSRAKSLRVWCQDIEGVLDQRGNPRRGAPDQNMFERRRAARERYKALVSKHNGLRGAVDATCYGCAGVGDDPGGINLIRDCKCTNCPLHAVRPIKSIKGRRTLGAE